MDHYIYLHWSFIFHPQYIYPGEVHNTYFSLKFYQHFFDKTNLNIKYFRQIYGNRTTLLSKSYFTFKFIIYYNSSHINGDLPNVTRFVHFASKIYFAYLFCCDLLASVFVQVWFESIGRYLSVTQVDQLQLQMQMSGKSYSSWCYTWSGFIEPAKKNKLAPKMH